MKPTCKQANTPKYKAYLIMRASASIIKKFDSLGYSLNPTFKGSNIVKTVFGGFFSIGLYAMLLFGCFYFGREIFERKQPFSNVSNKTLEQAEIGVEDLLLVFMALDDWGNLIHLDPRFKKAVDIRANFFVLDESVEGSSSLETYTVPLELCTVENIGQTLYATVKEEGFIPELFLCPNYVNAVDFQGNKIDKSKLTHKNPFGSPGSRHINVYLKVCDEKVSPGCQDFIKSIGTFHFNAFMPNYLPDMTDFDNPIRKNFYVFDGNVGLGLNFSALITFNINEIITDSGWILESTSSEVFYNINPPQYSVSAYSESERNLGAFKFDVRKIKTIYNRRYTKLQELLADLGGFFKGSIIIASFVVGKYSEYVLYDDISSMIKGVKQNKASKLQNNYLKSKELSDKQVDSNQSVTVLKVNKPELQKKATFWQFVGHSVTNNWNTKLRKEDCFKYLDVKYLVHTFTDVEQMSSEIREIKNFISNK